MNKKRSTEFQLSLPLVEPASPTNLVGFAGPSSEGLLYFGKAAVGMMAPAARVAVPVTPPLSLMGETFRTNNNQNRVSKNAP